MIEVPVAATTNESPDIPKLTRDGCSGALSEAYLGFPMSTVIVSGPNFLASPCGEGGIAATADGGAAPAQQAETANITDRKGQRRAEGAARERPSGLRASMQLGAHLGDDQVISCSGQ